MPLIGTRTRCGSRFFVSGPPCPAGPSALLAPRGLLAPCPRHLPLPRSLSVSVKSASGQQGKRRVRFTDTDKERGEGRPGRHAVHEKRGCRSKFGASLSITPRVPFPYLRLRKKSGPSYSAIRPKWTGNRKFCAGGSRREGSRPLLCRPRHPRLSRCAPSSLSVSVKRASHQLGKRCTRFTDTDKEREEGGGRRARGAKRSDIFLGPRARSPT